MSGTKTCIAAFGADPRLFAAAHRRGAGRAAGPVMRADTVAGGVAPVALRRLPQGIFAKMKAQEVSR